MSELSKKYQKLNPRQHVLLKTGMYLGDTSQRDENMYIYDNKIKQIQITYNPALYKIFDEILVNALDQSVRDKKVKNIKLTFSDRKITVYNDGIGIDIAKHPEHKIYIPEMIFGNLMTSTNYDDSEERVTGGTHGLGAKLTNIFSKEFTIYIGDIKRNKTYRQTFRDNLSIIEKPIIENKTLDTGFVEISFIPDFEKFNIKTITNDHIKLFKKRVIDSAGLYPNINFYVNDKQIKINSFIDYVNLYYNDKQNYIEFTCKDRWQIILISNVDQTHHISFVNGVYTSKNGKHFDYIMDQLIYGLRSILKNDSIKDYIIKSSISLFINCQIVNPSFSSQIKDEMTTNVTNFGSECSVPLFVFKRIKDMDIDLLQILKSKIQFQDMLSLQKVKSKKTNVLKNIPKLDDANYAGTTKSINCILILTEGDSAKATAIAGISGLKNGRDTFGVFPLKGKLLNVRDISNKLVSENEEIHNMIKILGLKFGATYTKESLILLRYGSILLMMDADEDGSHIKGLFINFLHHFFPSLLQIKGFLKVLITPVVKVTNNKTKLEFRNLQTFNIWKDKNPSENSKIKYYKGLGTSTSQEAKEYFINFDKNIMIIEDQLKQHPHPELVKAFAKSYAEQRKEWLRKYNPDLQIKFPRTVPVSISEFINRELINFSNYDNIRSIPSLIDGLKPSQRKVIYGCFKKNLLNEIKVAQLGAYVAEQTAYHHGENSLVQTIINLSQDFVGSNNINYLLPIGQFGTRLLGGKDHSSPRYIFTSLNKITRHIFRQEDDSLLNFLDDDGFKIEPETYIPIIPTVLLNGTEGIGTGFSTNIPPYNPKDLIKFIRAKLNKTALPILTPWFRHFKGQIYKIDDYNYISKGQYTISNNIIHIIELPIKLWLTDYKEYIQELVNNVDYLGRVEDQSSEIDVDIKIKIKDIDKVEKMERNLDQYNMSDLSKILKLNKTIKFTNVHLYNKDLVIKKYYNPKQIIEEFIPIRLDYYQKRKNFLLNKYKSGLDKSKSIMRFIIDINSNKLKMNKMKDEDIVNYLINNKFYKDENNFSYLLNLSLQSLSLTKIKSLETQIIELENKISELKKKTIEQLWTDDLDELERKL
jgi:DNA topoisomerase-2